jgi:hypothetical protein
MRRKRSHEEASSSSSSDSDSDSDSEDAKKKEKRTRKEEKKRRKKEKKREKKERKKEKKAKKEAKKRAALIPEEDLSERELFALRDAVSGASMCCSIPSPWAIRCETKKVANLEQNNSQLRRPKRKLKCKS